MSNPDFAWVDLGNGRQVYRRIRRPVAARSHLPTPMIRSDGMTATLNPIDGRHYESKSEYERVVRENGCEIVGNDAGFVRDAERAREYKPEGIRDDLKEAWHKLSS